MANKMWKCPICQKGFGSTNMVVAHVARRHSISAPVDLLPFRIVTRKRGSNSMAIVVAARQVPPQLNEEILDQAEAQPGMELALYNEDHAWDAMNLPLKKRLMYIRRVAHERNRFICHICGRVYDNHRALGGHKGQHTIEERKKKWSKEGNGGVMVVYMPQRRRPHECQRCGRVFSTGQGLGGHRQHCRGRPPPAVAGRVRNFDLNELPPPEEEDGPLELPWYNNDDN